MQAFFLPYSLCSMGKSGDPDGILIKHKKAG